MQQVRPLSQKTLTIPSKPALKQCEALRAKVTLCCAHNHEHVRWSCICFPSGLRTQHSLCAKVAPISCPTAVLCHAHSSDMLSKSGWCSRQHALQSSRLRLSASIPANIVADLGQLLAQLPGSDRGHEMGGPLSPVEGTPLGCSTLSSGLHCLHAM